MDTTETAEEELWDLLTCHRAASRTYRSLPRVIHRVIIFFSAPLQCVSKPNAPQVHEGPFPWLDPRSTPPAEPPAKRVKRSHQSPAWEQHVSKEVLADEAALAVLRGTDMHDSIHWLLPSRVSKTAGAALRSALDALQHLHNRHAPMIFKIGFTHSPPFRWENELFGHRWAKDGWTSMAVLYISSEPHSAAMMEAALIEKYMGNLPSLVLPTLSPLSLVILLSPLPQMS